MASAPELGKLALDIPDYNSSAGNHLPPEWPPRNDFPIVVGRDGETISRFGDQIWDVSIWVGYIFRFNFGDTPRRKDDFGNTPENSLTFKLIIIWWLYRPGKIRKPRRLMAIYTALRPMFVACSKEGVSALDLYKFPAVQNKIFTEASKGRNKTVIMIAHEIWESRDELGFYLLTPWDIGKIAVTIEKNDEVKQTPYIPPRIWLYQASRLRACLEDFMANREAIANCFKFCLDTYAHNAGSLAKACSQDFPAHLRPFNVNNKRHHKKHPEAIYFKTFFEVSDKFGITELLERWVPRMKKGGAASFSAYFNLISLVGTAYLVNFSLMRIEESFSLKTNSLSIERDENTGEDIYILTGVTTKTIHDDDARWITAPSAKLAIDVLSIVAKLRIQCAVLNPNVPISASDTSDPYLYQRPYEPWRKKSKGFEYTQDIRPTVSSYVATLQKNTKLFDPSEMRITDRDLESALLITPSLNPKEYFVGNEWSLGWHQLRRTGAVNMAGSGIVSESAMQYQLKHATRAMTRYYGSGHYHLRFGLNSSAVNEYVRTIYEMLAKEVTLVTSPRFISPHGEKRKEQLLAAISEKDHKALVSEARKGRINYRPMFLGACMNDGPCEYGGFEHVARCGGLNGSQPCESALYDKNMLPRIQALRDNLQTRLSGAEEGSPLETSLSIQKLAVENAINVINLS